MTLLWIALLFLALPLVTQSDGTTGGWNRGAEDFLLDTTCTIDRVRWRDVGSLKFGRFFLEKQPVIVEGFSQRLLSAATTKDALLRQYGNLTVVLSTANTNSYTKVRRSFGEYLATLAPHSGDHLGNETLYLFGPHSELNRHLEPLIRLYRRPPMAGGELAFSFGIGASGSGVPFHVHGHGFSEVIHGRKRWFLYPPEHKPPFDPDVSSVAWLAREYPRLRGLDRRLLQQCTIEPGDVLYFPSMWWHAVVNVGETVFVSSFASDAPGTAARRAAAGRRSGGAAQSKLLEL